MGKAEMGSDIAFLHSNKLKIHGMRRHLFRKELVGVEFRLLC